MHQPLIPAGGADLRTAEIISNLKYMMDNPGIGDNHNASRVPWCYKRMGEFIPQLIDEGKSRASCSITRARCCTASHRWGCTMCSTPSGPSPATRDYRRAVEWLGTPWGHAVAPSTPVQDFRLHVRAWQHHFAAIFGLEALARVRGFSPPEMALPNHPDAAYEFVKDAQGLRLPVGAGAGAHRRAPGEAGPERTHLPHRLVCTQFARRDAPASSPSSRPRAATRSWWRRCSPTTRRGASSRGTLGGRRVPPLVTQIADGENGGVMMNEFPSKYMEVMREASGSEHPLVNVTEYLEHLFALGIQEQDLPVSEPLHQKRIWDRLQPGAGPERLRGRDRRTQERGPPLPHGGRQLDEQHLLGPRLRARPGPMEQLSSLFCEKVSRPASRPREHRYRNALFHLLARPDQLLPLLGPGDLDGLRARDLPPRPGDPAPRLLAARAGGRPPAPQSAPRRRTGYVGAPKDSRLTSAQRPPGAETVQATDELSGLYRVLGSILSYPIVHTETRPITVTTFIAAGLFVVTSLWVSRRLRGVLQRRLFPRLHLDAGIEFSILRFAHYAVVTLGVLLGLKILQVDLTGIAVVAGILGVGIGFGLQNLASNFISGIILLIERPITVGDYVTVGDTDGEVRVISIRSTEIVTRDNISIIIPNAEFVSGRVVNWSHGDPRMRLRVAVGVSYKSDLDHVSRVLLEVARRQADVLEDPSPQVRLNRFGQSSLDFELLVWIGDPRHQEAVTSALHYAIRAAFLENGIEIPFPQQDLNIRSASTLRLLEEPSTK